MNELFIQFISLLRSLWRFRWIALIVAWFLALAGWSIVFVLPDQYVAEARVHADTESLLKPLLGGLVVNTDLSKRIELMKSTLLSRPNLKKIAQMTDLDLTIQTNEEEERLLKDLSKRIRVNKENSRNNIYSISYQNSNRQLARDVVQSLLTIFRESTHEVTRKDTDVAQDFLDQQIEEYRLKLEAAEERLKEFKQKNVGMMPTESGDYFARLEAALADYEEERLKMTVLEKQRDEIRRQIAGEEPSLMFVNSQDASQSESHANDEEIKEYKKREKELLLRFTSEHPDVVMVQEMIQALEKEREEDLAKAREERGGNRPAVPPLAENKVYQELRISLGQIEGSLAAARTRVANQKAKVERLRELVDTIPKIEAELKRMDRDYLIHKKNYEALVDRKESAIISENVEQQADKIKFRIIDPPHVGAEPAGPNRPLFSSAVLLMALGAGGVMAFFLGQLRPVFDTPRLLTQIVGKPVLGAVSLVASRGHRNLRRLEVLTFFIGLSSILLFYGLVVWLQAERFDVVGKVAGIVARFQ